MHDRTERVPGRLVEYAEERLLRLSRHFDRVQEVEVEFEDEVHRGSKMSFVVRITARADGHRHPVAHATEKAAEPRTALDLALDKMDRQVVKLKEKIKIERKRATLTAAGGDDLEAETAPGADLERVRLKLHPQSLEDAAEALAVSRNPCYVFLDEGTGTVSVCFRRADGGLTVIEPVVP